MVGRGLVAGLVELLVVVLVREAGLEVLLVVGRREGREMWEAFGDGGPWKREGGGWRRDCFGSGLEGVEDDAMTGIQLAG